MSNQEILEKAIQKAIEGGWDNNGHGKKYVMTYIYGVVRGITYTDDDTASGLCVYDIIFNHDFAKALWGDKFINPELRDDKGSRVIAFHQTAWRHHLRQMVIADDPIAYLGEQIKAHN